MHATSQLLSQVYNYSDIAHFYAFMQLNRFCSKSLNRISPSVTPQYQSQIIVH
jgi:hypothetical protein